MAEKLLMRNPRKVAPKKAQVEEPKRVVLVGTYKGNQPKEPHSDYSKTCEASET